MKKLLSAAVLVLLGTTPAAIARETRFNFGTTDWDSWYALAGPGIERANELLEAGNNKEWCYHAYEMHNLAKEGGTNYVARSFSALSPERRTFRTFYDQTKANVDWCYDNNLDPLRPTTRARWTKENQDGTTKKQFNSVFGLLCSEAAQSAIQRSTGSAYLDRLNAQAGAANCREGASFFNNMLFSN